MKKLMLVCAFVLGVSAVSFAQGGRPQRTPDEQVTQLKTQITGITDAQSAKLLVIYQAQTKSMDSLRTAANGDRAAMM
jgi:periplasmic protein CpxP/Spy